MNEQLSQWLAKAAIDRTMMHAGMREAGDAHEAAIYHAQQCLEKLLKAGLTVRGEVPPKIHDLVDLSRRLTALEPSWSPDETELRRLTLGAIHLRYPMSSATREQAEAAVAYCESILPILLALIPGAAERFGG